MADQSIPVVSPLVWYLFPNLFLTPKLPNLSPNTVYTLLSSVSLPTPSLPRPRMFPSVRSPSCLSRLVTSFSVCKTSTVIFIPSPLSLLLWHSSVDLSSWGSDCCELDGSLSSVSSEFLSRRVPQFSDIIHSPSTCRIWFHDW